MRVLRDPTVRLVLIVTLIRLVYLYFLCPYELVEDEAHYWEWSRRLGLSYYSKGPGVAWAIAAATHLLGVSEFAVRTPSVLSAAVASLGLAGLASDVYRSRRAGLYAAALYNLVPVFQFTSLLMTIDSPYIAAWALAARAGWRAVALRDLRWRWWLLLGVSLGVGFLFKYTILLLVPGLLLGALATRMDRPPRFGSPQQGLRWLACAVVFLAVISPVILWNIQNGWPTFRHLLGHLGLQGGDMAPPPPSSEGAGYDPRWTLELIAIQVVFLGAATAQIIGALAWAHVLPKTDPRRGGSAYLILCSIPIFLFYLGVTFIARAEGNWPIAGFVTLLALAGGWTAALRTSMSNASRTSPAASGNFAASAWRAGLWAGVIVGVLMLRVDLLARLPLIGPYVPIGRLIGARDQASHVQELRGALASRTSREPFIMVQHYGQASRLAFYLPGRPTVLCASSVTGGRKTQYDYWPDTSLSREDLAGRPGVLVGGELSQWEAAFADVESIGQLRGESKKNRQSFLGFEYKGFKPQGTQRLPSDSTPK